MRGLEGAKALAKDLFAAWGRHNVPRLAAALAYYGALSLAPLLLAMVGIAVVVFGPDAALGAVSARLAPVVGSEGAELIQRALAGAWRGGSGPLAIVISAGFVILGATGLTSQALDALRVVWEEPKKHEGIVAVVLKRARAALLVLGGAAALALTMASTAALAWVASNTIGVAGAANAVEPIVSVAVIALALTLTYRYLPESDVPWEAAFGGALLSAALYTTAETALGIYIGTGRFTNIYGAAGAVMALLLWLYATSLIILLGAEVSRAICLHRKAGA